MVAILALAVAAFFFRICSNPIFDNDEYPCFPEYEPGLDMALLGGATADSDRKKPAKKPVQGMLPLCLTRNLRCEYCADAAIAAGSDDEDPMRAPTLTQLGFGKAADVWLETRRPYLADETFRNYRGLHSHSHPLLRRDENAGDRRRPGARLPKDAPGQRVGRRDQQRVLGVAADEKADRSASPRLPTLARQQRIARPRADRPRGQSAECGRQVPG